MVNHLLPKNSLTYLTALLTSTQSFLSKILWMKTTGKTGNFDCAASEFYNEETGKYDLKGEGENGQSFTAEEFVDLLDSIVDKYPIVSIEDPLDENN
ncbi:hypothetical protein WP50_39205, partial [Lactiplantibacillus plantarum]